MDAAIAAAARDVLVAVIADAAGIGRMRRERDRRRQHLICGGARGIAEARRRRTASRWGRPPPRRSSRCGPMTGPMRHGWISTIRKGPNRVNGASRLTFRPAGVRARTGARSRRSSSSGARNSGPAPPITSAASNTRPTTTRSSCWAATTSRRRARGPRPDRDRPVLDRELASGLESPGARALGRRGLDLWENARLFGLLNLAMADGYIASWDTKYHYKFWRPITAIRLGDTDGNPYTRRWRTGPRCSGLIQCPITTPGTRWKAEWRRKF